MRARPACRQQNGPISSHPGLVGLYVLTPDFGTVKNLFNMASNGEVIYMKEFRVIHMNIFEIWVIALRFHLEGRNYAQSTKILYSEYSLGY